MRIRGPVLGFVVVRQQNSGFFWKNSRFHGCFLVCSYIESRSRTGCGVLLCVLVIRDLFFLLEDHRIASSKRVKRNEEIDAVEVRVIDSAGEQAGVMPLADAIVLAKGEGLDLVEVSPMAAPPVCRVMDFGKYLFEQNKKAQTAKRKQKQVHVKEIKFRPGTDEGDYNIKLRKLTEFLEIGDKTKVTLRFRGREMAHQELGANLLARVRKDLEEIGVVEQMPQMEGRQMIMVIAPKKK
jgi:translation initiation factor IF-3